MTVLHYQLYMCCDINFPAGFFLIYLAVFFLIGCPLMLLEVAIGQYSGQGILTAWKHAPLFMGNPSNSLLFQTHSS